MQRARGDQLLQKHPAGIAGHLRGRAVQLLHQRRHVHDPVQLRSGRDKMRGACPNCEKKALCMGGCPLMPEIVFCNSENRKQYNMEKTT